MAAGGEVEVEVQVRNTGRVVDQFTVQPLGQPAAWAEVDPAALRLLPNQEGSARIRFQPPRSTEVHAGRIPYGVQVTSRADPAKMVRIESSLELEPFGDIEAELIPGRRRAGGSRTSWWSPTPAASRWRSAWRSAISISGCGSRYDLSGAAAPDHWASAQVAVRPRRLRLFGQPVTHPFQAAVTRADPEGREGAALTTVDGSMLQRALLPAWAILLLPPC